MIDDYINAFDQFSIPELRNSVIVAAFELVYADNFADDLWNFYGEREVRSESFPLDFFSEGLALFTYYYG